MRPAPLMLSNEDALVGLALAYHTEAETISYQNSLSNKNWLGFGGRLSCFRKRPFHVA